MSKLISYVGVILIAAATALWPATALAGGGGGCYRSTQGEGDTVEISKACFTPNILHTDLGAKVAFINEDPIPHNVVATAWGHFDNLGEGESFTATFKDPGIYPFACTLHPGMTGAVVVGDGTGAGSGRVVIVDSAFDTSAAKPAVSRVPATSPATGSPLGWVGLGAAAGLILGGIMAAVRRRRA